MPLKFRPPILSAIRATLKGGYALTDLKTDAMAGAITGMVAIPLAMALAIASGVPPQHGLYTVLVAGGLVALLGGSRFNVTGPTAAFVVILFPIAQQFGLGGLLLAGVMSGIILLLLGLTGLGQIIRLIPHPVTTGFTSGIAVVIATIQLKDFFGLEFEKAPEHYWERISELVKAAPTFSYIETTIAFVTLTFLLLWPKFNKKIPAPLIALTVVTVIVGVLQKYFPGLEIATIENTFTSETHGVVTKGIPQTLPSLIMPWTLAGPDGTPIGLSFSIIQDLLPSALAIAMLGAIESLLCAVVADSMTQTQHDPNAELVALGIGNIAAPFFGGIAATGAIARTATNIRFGAKSPFASMIHALFTLIVLLVFAPYVSYLPMASIAALMMLIAYNMSEVKHFTNIVSVAQKSDVVVLLTCFLLTVLFDMVIGVGVGVGLAAMLFMRRMAVLSYGKVLNETKYHPHKNIPRDIIVYEIGGPLFFGAAEKAITGIKSITDSVRAVIFDLADVPAVDITGVVAFESAVKQLKNRKIKIILCTLRPMVEGAFRKSPVLSSRECPTFETVEEALQSLDPGFKSP